MNYEIYRIYLSFSFLCSHSLRLRNREDYMVEDTKSKNNKKSNLTVQPKLFDLLTTVYLGTKAYFQLFARIILAADNFLPKNSYFRNS